MADEASNAGPPKGHVGQKPRLPTEEETRKIARVIRRTGFDKEAFTLAGVPERTFYKWMALGQRQAAAGEGGPFVQFVQAVHRARALRTKRLLSGIEAAAAEPKHWQARAWLLERADPKRFSPRYRVHVTEEFDGALSRLRAAFADDPDGYAKALSALAGGHGADGTGALEGRAEGEDDSGSEALPAAQPESEAEALP